MEKEAEKPKTASFSLLQGEKMSTKFIASGDSVSYTHLTLPTICSV